MSETLIRASGLSKEYGEIQALADLDWELPKGSITGVLGPNGAGKTTLAKLIMGITQPTAGEVIVTGTEVAKDPVQGRRAIGFLPEEKLLYSDMRAGTFLRFYGGFFPEFAVDTANGLIDGWEIPRRARIRDLSKGNRAKLGLAAVLAGRPRILLLDEPTLDLDPASTEEVLSLVAGWVADGDRGVLITTHRLEEVERICDRVLFLEQGRAVANDNLDDLRDRWRLVRASGTLPPTEEMEGMDAVRAVRSGEGWAALVVESESQDVIEALRSAGATSVTAERMPLRDIYLTMMNYNRGRLDGVLESLV